MLTLFLVGKLVGCLGDATEIRLSLGCRKAEKLCLGGQTNIKDSAATQ